MLTHSLQSISRLLIFKDTLLVPYLDNMRHDAFIELRMPLHGDEPAFFVHALYETAWRGTELLYIWGILEDDVPMHLVDCL